MGDSRLKRCDALMEQANLDQMIVTSAVNLFYFTGAWVESNERLMALVVTPQELPLLLIHRMFQHEVRDIAGVELLFWEDHEQPLTKLSSLLRNGNVVGVDKTWPSQFLISLMKENPTLRYESASPVIDQLRQIKMPDEINKLRESAASADRVIDQLIRREQFPTTELELVEKMRKLFAEEGVQHFSFSPIIGFGASSAVPHHRSSSINSTSDHAVLIDMGGRLNEYCSDMTRTVYLGRPNEKFQEVYETVLEAQMTAISAVKPGVTAAEIDHAARNVIIAAGYGEYFTHRTGHGLGIEIHEEPYIHGNNPQLLEPGMVFSIEPGIYLPGEFGVRIEDIVVVTNDGVEVLNQASKKLTWI